MGALTGKYAVVTGGARGIGEAVARRFVKEDAAGVAILDYDGETAAETAAALGGNHTIAVQCDVSDRDSVQAAFEEVYDAFGTIDILINNAGIIRDAIYHKMTYEQWDQVIAVNLHGVNNCCRQVVPKMREQMYGKIVNISSSSAYGNAGQANYSATKAGLIGFTKTLAKELGQKNITVNAIAPAMIDTDMIKSVPELTVKMVLELIPLKRLGTPDELANAVLFLSSDESSYINGIVLDVNGGMIT